MDTDGGQGTITPAPSPAYQRRHQTSYPRRYRSTLATGHEWADTDSVDDESVVNSADLQGFVRIELEALSAGIDDFPSDLSSFFTQEESSKLENAAMDLSSVPEALVTIRAARDKMKGKCFSRFLCLLIVCAVSVLHILCFVAQVVQPVEKHTLGVRFCHIMFLFGL